LVGIDDLDCTDDNPIYAELKGAIEVNVHKSTE